VFHAAAGLPSPFDVHGFDGAGRGDEVGNFRFGVAGLAPCRDVGFGGGLVAVFYAADLGEVAANADR
jgi:hypothetical protein